MGRVSREEMRLPTKDLTIAASGNVAPTNSVGRRTSPAPAHQPATPARSATISTWSAPRVSQPPGPRPQVSHRPPLPKGQQPAARHSHEPGSRHEYCHPRQVSEPPCAEAASAVWSTRAHAWLAGWRRVPKARQPASHHVCPRGRYGQPPSAPGRTPAASATKPPHRVVWWLAWWHPEPINTK